jgi:hypothetical protein
LVLLKEISKLKKLGGQLVSFNAGQLLHQFQQASHKLAT